MRPVPRHLISSLTLDTSFLPHVCTPTKTIQKTESHFCCCDKMYWQTQLSWERWQWSPVCCPPLRRKSKEGTKRIVTRQSLWQAEEEWTQAGLRPSSRMHPGPLLGGSPTSITRQTTHHPKLHPHRSSLRLPGSSTLCQLTASNHNKQKAGKLCLQFLVFLFFPKTWSSPKL